MRSGTDCVSVAPAALQSIIVRSAGLIDLAHDLGRFGDGVDQRRLARGRAARCSTSRRALRRLAPRRRGSRAGARAPSRASRRRRSARCFGEPCTSTVPPSSAQRAIRRVTTSSVRARTAASGSVSESPAGLTSSQCRPVTTRPADSTTRRMRAASARVDPLGRFGERERRDLEAVVAERGRRARTGARAASPPSTSLQRAIFMPRPRRPCARARNGRPGRCRR